MQNMKKILPPLKIYEKKYLIVKIFKIKLITLKNFIKFHQQ